MSFFRQFEIFDAIKGYVPEHPMAYLPETAGRARSK